jgi:Flp pilus assembly protein CpaB
MGYRLARRRESIARGADTVQRNRRLILIGLLLAIVTFLVVYMVLGTGAGGQNTPGPSPTPHPTIAIVVAKSDIASGTIISADMVDTANQDATLAAPDVITESRQVVGLRIRSAVLAKQPLTVSMFQGEGGSSNLEVLRNLEPGYLAMAVQVDQVNGIGALLQTGDRVDIIIALEDVDNKFPVLGKTCDPAVPLLDTCLNNTSVKILVQDAKVLGTLSSTVGSTTAPGASPAPNASPVPGAVTFDGRQTLVILQLRPQDVEAVRFAQLDGNLSLVLRATADSGATPATTTGITLYQLIHQYGVLVPNLVNAP